MVILSADDWVCIFVLFVVAQGATGGWVMLALIFKWFPLCEFSLFDTPWTSLVALRLKRLPAMRETQVRSLGWEDPLEKEMATHSSILAWRIPWMEETGRLQSTRSQRVR